VEAELLTVQEVMVILNCSERHLERIVGKQFPEPMYIAGARYWTAKDLDAYLYMLSRNAFKDLLPKKAKPGDSTDESEQA